MVDQSLKTSHLKPSPLLDNIEEVGIVEGKPDSYSPIQLITYSLLTPQWVFYVPGATR
jgi:hypothetical protein